MVVHLPLRDNPASSFDNPQSGNLAAEHFKWNLSSLRKLQFSLEHLAQTLLVKCAKSCKDLPKRLASLTTTKGESSFLPLVKSCICLKNA